MGAFETIVTVMRDLDLFSLGFPFLLVFVVMYGVLSKYDFFEDENITAVASLSFAFMAVGGIFVFVPGGFLVNFAGVVGVTVIVVFGLLIVLASAGVDLEEYLHGDGSGNQRLPAFLGASAVLVGVGVLLFSYLDLGRFVSGDVATSGIASQLLSLLLTLAVIGGVIYFVVSED